MKKVNAKGKTLNYVLLDERMGSWSEANKRAQEAKKATGLNTAVYKKR